MLDKAPLFVTLSPNTEVATVKCTLPCPVAFELALVSGGPSLPGTAGQREWPQLFAGQGGDVQAGARRGLLAPSPRGAAPFPGLHARCTQVIHTVPEPRQAGRCFLMERCAYFVKKHPLAPRRFFFRGRLWLSLSLPQGNLVYSRASRCLCGGGVHLHKAGGCRAGPVASRSRQRRLPA